MKILLLLLIPVSVLANGNHGRNSHHVEPVIQPVQAVIQPVIYVAPVVEYVEPETYHNDVIINKYTQSYYEDCRGTSINTAMLSIPEISHARGHKSSHTGIGIGAGAYKACNAGAIGLTHHNGRLTLKLNVGSSAGQKAIGGGFTWDF